MRRRGHNLLAALIAVAALLGTVFAPPAASQVVPEVTTEAPPLVTIGTQIRDQAILSRGVNPTGRP